VDHIRHKVCWGEGGIYSHLPPTLKPSLTPPPPRPKPALQAVFRAVLLYLSPVGREGAWQGIDTTALQHPAMATLSTPRKFPSSSSHHHIIASKHYRNITSQHHIITSSH
jgi:hypothetical protein